jgi:predicted short-subunit dehydrogenase-like oxidoreductase (DUF2520 family)
MRQVPSTYLVIGSGRVAKHFERYLSLLDLPFKAWSRRHHTVQELRHLAEVCSPILLLISDTAIPEFLSLHPFLNSKNLVHFSGSLTVEGVQSAHPLMTFAPGVYDLETYKNIPFILSDEGPDLAVLLPGLPNQAYRISEQKRPYYHALCVLSGNFTALLWQKFYKELESRFQLPPEVLHPYLKQVMQNLLTSSQQALTGPLARGDQKTISANLKALENDHFQGIYQAFVEAYKKTEFIQPQRG